MNTPIVNLEKQILEGLGYHISAMTSCEKALQIFTSSSNEFDLVIADMTMPAMTGVDLSKRLLALRPDIPIIICTGFSNLIDAEKASRLGIRRLLLKPVTRKELAMVVREILDT